MADMHSAALVHLDGGRTHWPPPAIALAPAVAHTTTTIDLSFRFCEAGPLSSVLYLPVSR